MALDFWWAIQGFGILGFFANFFQELNKTLVSLCKMMDQNSEFTKHSLSLIVLKSKCQYIVSNHIPGETVKL